MRRRKKENYKKERQGEVYFARTYRQKNQQASHFSDPTGHTSLEALEEHLGQTLRAATSNWAERKLGKAT